MYGKGNDDDDVEDDDDDDDDDDDGAHHVGMQPRHVGKFVLARVKSRS